MNSPKPPSPTIIDVANLAGVSVATVSRVINHTGPVADQTVLRVVTAINELNYVPSSAARNLSSRRTNTIGLILTDINWINFFPPLLRGIQIGAAEAGYDLLIHSSQTYIPTTNLRPVGEHNTDGILIFTDGLPDEEILRLNRKGFPMVLLFRSPPPETSIPFVLFANKAGTRAVVDHLIETHHYKHIAYLTGPEESEEARWREKGYRDSLITHGMSVDPNLIGRGDFDINVARSTVQDWLNRGVEIDAICAADDDSAIGAMLALQAAQKIIPDEIALVGFDDIPNAQYLTPPLTTVRAPIEEAAYQAVNTLIDLIRNNQPKPLDLFPTHLIVRRSCGCNAD